MKNITKKCKFNGCETTMSGPDKNFPKYCPEHNDLNVSTKKKKKSITSTTQETGI